MLSTASMVAVAAVLVGATVQSATGFGFAIVTAPVLAATAGPETAAPTVAVTGLLATTLLLVAEGRRSEVLRHEAAVLILWSLPGMALGVAILAVASEDVLSVLVAAGVLLAVAAHAWRARRMGDTPREPAGRSSTAAAGAVSGTMSTTTGLNGPPLVLHLLGRATPGQTRDTLSTIFLVTGVLSIAAFVASGTFELAPDVWALIAAAVGGWAIGRRAFVFLHDHHEAASLAVLAVGGTVALVVAVQALG